MYYIVNNCIRGKLSIFPKQQRSHNWTKVKPKISFTNVEGSSDAYFTFPFKTSLD